MKPSLALDLDELLTNPRYARAAVVLRQMLPVGYRDQVDAAHGETEAVRGIIIDALPADSFRGGYAAAEAHPEWLRLGACDALAGWITGDSATCMHEPHPSRPQPLMACAWKPGLVVCMRCVHLLPNPRGSVADKTCDSCGHVCTGPENDDGIFSGLVQLGVMIYEFGTCTSCHADMPVPTSV